MRCAGALVAALFIAACSPSVRPCKKGTLFVTLRFDSAAATADSLDAQIMIEGQGTMASTVAFAGVASGTIEYNFPSGYPAGKAVTVSITASKAGQVVAGGSGTVTLPASSCGALTISVGSGGGNDLLMSLDDLATEQDLLGVDLFGVDFSMASVVDMTTVDDLAGVDLAGRDFAMLPTFTPSHVSSSFYNPSAGNLSGVTTIFTAAGAAANKPTVNGVWPPSAPGVSFDVDGNGNAVLTVGSWTVDQPIMVTGSRPLVVIAAGAVVINNGINVGAKGTVPGPGGLGAGAGSGHGNNGTGVAMDGGSSGGGGGSFGSSGGAGGTGGGGVAGMPGNTFGNLLSSFEGGSGGGSCIISDCTTTGFGGGGGGALQISSAVSITVGATAVIHAGGGGGAAGCDDNGIGNIGGGGGGGGSGGLIFLEAPTITSIVGSMLAANGGGGGSGGGLQGAGSPGDDAKPSNTIANGGDSPYGKGGSGAYTSGSLVPAGAGPSGGFNSPGGGGGVGRIWMRTRGTPASIAGIQSPAVTIDTSL